MIDNSTKSSKTGMGKKATIEYSKESYSTYMRNENGYISKPYRKGYRTFNYLDNNKMEVYKKVNKMLGGY